MASSPSSSSSTFSSPSTSPTRAAPPTSRGRSRSRSSSGSRSPLSSRSSSSSSSRRSRSSSRSASPTPSKREEEESKVASKATTKVRTKAQRKHVQPTQEQRSTKDDDDDDKVFDDGLDDQLIGDEADRQRLFSMTEREREAELFRRAENRDQLKKRFEIQKKLNKQKAINEASKKEDVADDEDTRIPDDDVDNDDKDNDIYDDEDDDESYSAGQDVKERSQDRRKNLETQRLDKKSTALSELKARKRERDRKQMEQRRLDKQKEMEKTEGDNSESDEDEENQTTQQRRHQSRRDSSSTASSRQSSSSGSARSRSRSSSGSEMDSDTERFSKTQKVEKFVEVVDDLEPIRLSRHKMERFVNLPHFKRVVTGCFVRIGIGQNPQGKSVYRCTQIVDTCETGKVYHLGKIKTNQGMKLKFGKQERVFRLEFISNSAFAPSEFEKWKYTCEEQAIPLPSKEFVQTKSEEIKRALNYEYSSADVDAIIEKKERFTKNPINYAMTKARLMKDKEMAMADHDEDTARDIEQQLQELEQKAEELDKRRTENTLITSVSFINNRNRKYNVLKAEQAILEEMRRKEEEGQEDNPFTRRKCNPRMVTKNKFLDDQSDGQGINVAQKVRSLAQEKENQERLQRQIRAKEEEARKLQMGKHGKSSNDDHATEPSSKRSKGLESSGSHEKEDLFAAHNFDIEIDVDASLSSTSAFTPATPFVAATPDVGKSNSNANGSNDGNKTSNVAKRSINLSDYKKRKGLI